MRDFNYPHWLLFLEYTKISNSINEDGMFRYIMMRETGYITRSVFALKLIRLQPWARSNLKAVFEDTNHNDPLKPIDDWSILGNMYDGSFEEQAYYHSFHFVIRTSSLWTRTNISRFWVKIVIIPEISLV